jgi:uncharacterized protein YdbL (DUF1318 family)
MNRHTVSAIALVSACAFLAACLTVNVYFPEAAITDMSQQIEREVQKRAAAKAAGETMAPLPENPAPGTPADGDVSLLDLFFGVTPAYAAQVVEPEVTSPAIRTIIESRASRLAALDRFKALGVIGESNQGLVETRDLDKLEDLKQRAEVQRLVKAENTDRAELYKEVAAAKGVDLSQLGKIRETYAATLRDNAKTGEWIQKPDGSWAKK